MDDRTAGDARRLRSSPMRAWRSAAEDGLSRVVAGGAAAYDRRRALPRLIGFDPRDLEREDGALDRSIRARLTRALRAERRRGRAGHWAYDLDRHLALLQALDGEAARGATAAAPRPAPKPETKKRRPAGPDGV